MPSREGAPCRQVYLKGDIAYCVVYYYGSTGRAASPPTNSLGRSDMHAKKEKLRVEIYTTTHRIVADLHIFAGARLTDIMQSRETQSFFALTDVEVYDIAGGQLPVKTDFIDINKAHVVMLRPMEVPERRPRQQAF